MKTPMRIVRMLRTVAGLLVVLAIPAAAQSPRELQPTVRAAPVAPAPRAGAARAAVETPTPPAQLDAADVNTWLDGFMPPLLDTNDIAGAVVVVVRDGQVLTQRGFGYADVKARRPVDPAATLFRPGSISKLFTWTAVMQQVQAGKLDLDRDVNAYLDFKIPPAFGKPITLRNLMTHTPGFAETAKNLLVYDPRQSLPLEQALKRSVPTRIYAPGTMPAYSNYGASLAGYIVQRVSGEAFDRYVQRHIFQPLGMAHSSFAQPLPPALAGGMAKGYGVASQPPKPFELIDLAPAGALSATGADMARFMVAHLGNGGAILAPRTAALMHAPANTPIPGLPSMALGFYHEDRNGQTIIGHAGDTDLFHSDLHLYLDRGVGLYVSFNSAGKGGAAHTVRDQLFDGFTNRYFPVPRPQLPAIASAHDHGAAMAGHYVSSRASGFNFLRLIGLLGNAVVSLNDDDTLSVSSLVDAAGVAKRWREVAPWHWAEVGGSDELGAVVKNGRVAMFAPAAFAPIIEFVPAPAGLNSGWIQPLLLASLAIALLTALSWPILALVRRSYGYKPAATGEVSGRPLQLYRASRATAWAMLAVAIGWLLILQTIGSDTTALNGRLDGWMRLLQLLEIAAIIGALLSVWHAWLMIRRRERGRFAKLWSVLFALAALFLAWLVVDAGLLTLGLNY